MAIQHAVLGLLAAGGPSYGYEIKARFERAVGPQWQGVNLGHVYQILDRLGRDGLATSRTQAGVARFPDRMVYRITAAGRRELESWLAEPSSRAVGFRDDFFIKLFVAALDSEQAVLDFCRIQRDDRMAQLQLLRERRRQHKDEALASTIIETTIGLVQAELRAVESVATKGAAALRAELAAFFDEPATEEEPVERPRRRAAG